MEQPKKEPRAVLFQRLGLEFNVVVYGGRDNLTAHLRVTQRDSKAARPPEEDVLKALDGSGITLVEDVGARILEAFAIAPPHEIPEIIIAEGVHPQKGKAEDAKWFIDLSEETKIQIVGDQADFRDIKQIAQVKAGDPILEVIPAEKGAPGVDVLGKPIEGLPGDDLELKWGENVEFDKSSRILRAKVAGRVRSATGMVWVDPIYKIEGDVSFSTGNVNFEGDVSIQGNVQDGFEVKAARNITVYGSVFASTLIAGGTITIHEGVNGHGQAKLTAGGSIAAKYVKDATLTVGGDLRVTSEVFSSSIRVNGKIFVTRGTIVGGEVVALRGIDVRTLGSPMQVPTKVTVGVDPEIEKRAKELRAQMTTITKQIERIYLTIKPYVDNPATITDLPDSRKDWVRSLLQSLAALKTQKVAVEKELSTMDAPTIGLKELKIFVSKEVCGKVTVVMGPISTTFATSVAGPCTLVADEEKKRIGPKAM